MKQYVDVRGLRASQVAEILDVSTARVHQMLRRGQLPYCQTALGRLVDPEAVERLRIERSLRQVKGSEHVAEAA